ncbi:hypothetical protein KSF_025400 [Reticulibacter mediterranei]|uniref:Uncharacterized protein n=1 Tax=Reticulibacter mediterranei TaxID=2778369 RepID=A0A8J3N2U3_9CHLR|nr:hypothetical protein KSF_025400 [Reticulibacter mediterranei]
MVSASSTFEDIAEGSSTNADAASKSFISDAAGSVVDECISIVCCSSFIVRLLQSADVLFVLSTIDVAEFIKDVLSTDKDVGICLSIGVLDIRYP